MFSNNESCGKMLYYWKYLYVLSTDWNFRSDITYTVAHSMDISKNYLISNCQYQNQELSEACIEYETF